MSIKLPPKGPTEHIVETKSEEDKIKWLKFFENTLESRFKKHI